MSPGQQDAVQHAGTMASRLARHTPRLSLKSTVPLVWSVLARWAVCDFSEKVHIGGDVKGGN